MGIPMGDNGADLQIIQEMMGHSHLSQTTQYLHLSTKRINQTINPFDAMVLHLSKKPDQTP